MSTSTTVSAYEVDYKAFENASATVSELNDKLEDVKTVISNAKKVLSDENVFSGPVADSCMEAFDDFENIFETRIDEFNSVKNYFEQISDNYKKGDKDAANLILSKGEDGKFVFQKAGLVGNSNEEKIFNYFKAKGLTDAEACGIMACIYHESRFLPGADRQVPGDESYGICQWLAERRTLLEDYCKKNGKEVSDLEAQLDFIFYECETTQKIAALNNIKAITGESEDAAAAAADRWLIDYEGIGRSKQTYSAHSAMRQETARQLYQKYHK